MTFIHGSSSSYNIGKSSMSARIHKFRATSTLNVTPTVVVPNVTNTYCGPCGDDSQVDLHTATAIVFNCMDFRLRDNVTCHLNLKGYKNGHDDVIAAGASLGYNGLSDLVGWDKFIDTHVTLSYDLHDISQIIIIEHEKCGAYKVQYGELTPADEYIRHVENAKECADTLWGKFNPIAGTITKISKLNIIAYIISIDGCSLTEIYRRS